MAIWRRFLSVGVASFGVMNSGGNDEVDAVFDDLDAVLARARALPVDAMNIRQQLAMLERC
ncbi:hypothetical protein BST39_06205, partial [Mycobacterium paraseoulense]